MTNTTDSMDPNVPSQGTAAASDEADVQSLAKMAHMDVADVGELENATQAEADRAKAGSNIITVNGHEAAASPPSDGPHGMSHVSPAGEVGGGNISAVLDPPVDTSATKHPLTKERAALLSPVARAIAGFIQRPVSEWGVLGPGDTVRGSMLLLDLTTGEKVRGMDGHRIGPDKLYANLRNFPEALSTGDTIQRLLGTVPSPA